MPEIKQDIRTATIVVAASNSRNKAMADYVCPGINDEVTIQKAVDALPASGGRVILLEGTFKVKADTGLNLEIPSNSSLIGQPNATILEAVSGGNCIVSVGKWASTTVENITVKDLILGSSGTADGDGIGVGRGNTVILRNILVENIRSLPNFPKSTVDISHTTMVSVDIFENIIVRGMVHEGGLQQPGISLVAAPKSYTSIGGFWIEDCYIKSAFDDGIRVEGPLADVHIVGNTILSPGRYGITVQNKDAFNPVGVWVERNFISGMTALGSAGIYILGGIDLHITNNSVISERFVLRFGSGGQTTTNAVVSKNYLKTTGANHAAIYGDVGISKLIIEGNYLEVANYYPIRLQGTGSILVIGNIGHDVSASSSMIRADDTYTGKVTDNFYNVPYFAEGTGLQFREVTNELFMDVLAVSATHIRSNENLSAAIPLTFTIDAQPDVPRTLSGHFDSHANITAYSITITGIDAKGNTITETKTEANGWDWKTSNAFATITSIIMTARTGTGAGDTMDIGITDVLGLSNDLLRTSDVFKIKKNNANATAAVAQVNTTYDTYDMAVIGLADGDDFTIYSRRHLNRVI